jgi:hypothetical protein
MVPKAIIGMVLKRKTKKKKKKEESGEDQTWVTHAVGEQSNNSAITSCMEVRIRIRLIMSW